MHSQKGNVMTITEKQNALFEELRKTVPEAVLDGVVEEGEYCSAPIRLMFVLKEVNGKTVPDLCDFLKKGRKTADLGQYCQMDRRDSSFGSRQAVEILGAEQSVPQGTDAETNMCSKCEKNGGRTYLRQKTGTESGGRQWGDSLQAAETL